MLFSIKEAIAFGWRTTLNNFWFLVGMLLIVLAINVGFSILAGIFEKGAPFISFLINIASMAVSMIVGMGVISVYLHLHRGERPPYKEIFSKAHLFWRFLWASILYGVMLLVGFLLLIIPGVYLALRFGFYQFLIVDHERGAVESLKESSRLTESVKWKLLGFVLLLGLINIAGVLALLVGLFFTIPTTVLAVVYVYKKLHARLSPAVTPAVAS